MSAVAIAERVALGAGGVSQRRVFHSEWVKLRSLRSTFFSLLAALVCVVGLGILFGALRANDIKHFGGPRLGDFDPTAVSLRGVFLAQLAVGVLGALLVTGEYSTGMIRATLAAVPRRLPVLWAKVAVFGAVVFVVGLIASFLAFEGGQAMLASAHVQAGLGSPGAARAVLGGALYLTVVGLIAVGLGFMLRNTGAAIGTLMGLMLVLPLLAQALPSSWYNDIFKYLPMVAGTEVMTTVRDPAGLSPWAGIGVFSIYAVVAIALGAAVLKRRDA